MAGQLTADDASRAALDVFQARHGKAGASGTALRAGAPARIVRLDQTDRGYFLVPILDASSGLRGIVQIDAQSGAEETSALIVDPSAAFLLPEAAALAAARRARPQVRDWGKPFLGWRPCRESFNSLQPLWVVPHGDRAVYVDQSGRAFDQLSLGGRGG